MTRSGVKNITTKKTLAWCRNHIFQSVRTRGKSIAPRDSLNLRLASTRNSAVLRLPGSHGVALCRPQVDFDIIADDNGRTRWLIPDGIHFQAAGSNSWKTHIYDGLRRQFLWPLFIREEPAKGLKRICKDLFRVPGGIVEGGVPVQHRRSFGNLHMEVRRMTGGGIETSLRHLRSAKSSLYLPREVGLKLSEENGGHIVLVFGSSVRIGISLLVQEI
ncbi:MAG: hypothetical protein ACOC0U_01645 [Desulfovibrionales bacterium]